MEAIRNSWCNFTYLGPREGIGDLPCQVEEVDGQPVCYAFYKPDADEIDALRRGATIRLGIWSAPIPPVSLGVIVTGDDEIAPKEPEAVLA